MGERAAGGHRGGLPQGSCVKLTLEACPESPMDRGAWRITVYGVAKSQARLSDYHFSLCRGRGQSLGAARQEPQHMPRSPKPPALRVPSILFVLSVPRFPLPAKSLNDLFQLPCMHQGHEASIPHTGATHSLLWAGPGTMAGTRLPSGLTTCR